MTTVHLVQAGASLTTCCEQSPFELPLTDRISSDAAARTCTRLPKAKGCRYPNLDKGDGEGCGESACPVHGDNACPACMLNDDGYSLAHTHLEHGDMVACAPVRCPGCRNCPFLSDD